MGRRRRFLILLTIASVLPAAIWSRPTRAANLLFAADYLNRQQANSTSGITHQVFFTPATALPGTGNSLRLAFTSSPGNTWCRVAGADIGVTGISDPTGGSENATPLPGTLTASCTIGNGSTTFDTITISAIDPLLAGTKYGLALTDPGTGKLGTPPTQNSTKLQLTTNNGSADIDTLLFYTVTIPNDRVVISAVVLDPNPFIPNPVVRFSGLAGSAADLTITRGSTVVSTSTLGVNGQFDITLADQPVGEQTYVVAANDSAGRSFSSLTFILNLLVNTNTDLSNIFLGPSISANAGTFTLGQQITFSGTTVPLSAVTLDISTVPLTTTLTSADAAGHWQIVVPSDDLGIGTWAAHARSVFNSTTSVFGPQISVTITAPGTTNTNTTPPGNANTNTGPSLNTNRPLNVNAPVVHPPTKFALTDFNADGVVNLIDFSILMFYWHQSNPANAATDVNRDQMVDIIDISIMLFQWTSIA